MTKTIELTDLKITQMIINYEANYVYVEYKLLDIDGQEWGGQSVKSAIFWVTVPPIPSGQTELPENWFELPSSYFPTLLALQADADAALTARFLV
jgi:hypothetical protein